MYKVAYNRALLRYRIETVTPLLIRSGLASLESVVDLECVRTRHAALGPSVYIPGSSFKGVVRSAAESFVRSRSYGGVDGACDPFSKSGCGSHKSDGPTHEVHKQHCLACRLFGSLRMKGRASLRDLHPWSGSGAALSEGEQRNFDRANGVEIRHGVGIDRITGATHGGAKFEMEVVPSGVTFYGETSLENYQIWQLGLLFSAFDEVDDGFAQLGSTQSRGLGVARIHLDAIIHEQMASAGDTPKGVGALMPSGLGDDYGLLREADLPASESRTRGLLRRFEVMEAAALREWRDAAANALGGLA